MLFSIVSLTFSRKPYLYDANLLLLIVKRGIADDPDDHFWKLAERGTSKNKK